MSGLLDSLTLASRSLTAARLGMDVTGQNLANVNTPGYTRRVVTFAEVPPTDALSSGGGVTATGIQAMRDRFVEARLRAELGTGAFDSAVLDGLTEVEALIGLPGQTLDAAFAAFFDSFQALADDPTSPSARDAVIVQAQELSRAFNDIDDRLLTVRRNADLSMVSTVDEVNRLAAEVARLNDAISANGSDVESLRDARDVVVSKLTELAGVSATLTVEGGVDLSIGSGRLLVAGSSSYAVTTSTGGPLGFSTLNIGGYDITTEVSAGLIGGLISVRDVVVPGYQTRLDQLAFDVAGEINTLHQTGFDANGAAGGTFFTTLSTLAGAAAAIALDPGVAADGRLIAASGTGAVGDNQTARSIAALRATRFMSGGTATPTEAWAQLAHRVGVDVGTARSAGALHDDVSQQLERLRAQTSGVSLDEEAAMLMRFQRSYEANARYFTTIVDTLDTLMDMVR